MIAKSFAFGARNLALSRVCTERVRPVGPPLVSDSAWGHHVLYGRGFTTASYSRLPRARGPARCAAVGCTTAARLPWDHRGAVRLVGSPHFAERLAVALYLATVGCGTAEQGGARVAHAIFGPNLILACRQACSGFLHNLVPTKLFRPRTVGPPLGFLLNHGEIKVRFYLNLNLRGATTRLDRFEAQGFVAVAIYTLLGRTGGTGFAQAFHWRCSVCGPSSSCGGFPSGPPSTCFPQPWRL